MYEINMSVFCFVGTERNNCNTDLGFIFFHFFETNSCRHHGYLNYILKLLYIASFVAINIAVFRLLESCQFELNIRYYRNKNDTTMYSDSYKYFTNLGSYNVHTYIFISMLAVWILQNEGSEFLRIILALAVHKIIDGCELVLLLMFGTQTTCIVFWTQEK